nr:hypothetical protein [Vibrio parahaemolyticus]
MEKEVIEVVTQSKRALGELKPAFRACPQAYTELCKAVNEGRVSLYRLKSADCSLVIAGERDGDNYFLWGVAGRGSRSAFGDYPVMQSRESGGYVIHDRRHCL